MKSKNYIQRALRRFEHELRIRPKKMLHTKMEGKLPYGRPITRWRDQIRKNIEM